MLAEYRPCQRNVAILAYVIYVVVSTNNLLHTDPRLPPLAFPEILYVA